MSKLSAFTLNQSVYQLNTCTKGSMKKTRVKSALLREGQGRHHEVLIGGGGGVGFIGTQTHLSPKFSFSSDFGHFILKMLENAKNYTF